MVASFAIFAVSYITVSLLKIAYHPSYMHPLPEGHRFPMIKYELIPAQLLYSGLIQADSLFEPDVASFQTIVQAHAADYCHQLIDVALPPAMVRRIGFPLSEALVARELRIVQGTIDGCFFAMQHGVALNVAGGTHHAGHDWGEGFCLLNDQAVAAAHLVNNGICRRVVIIDLDVHQGNGTAQIFGSDSRVFTFSMHGARNFPFRKERSDRDVGLPDGTGDEVYLELLAHHLDWIFEEVQPDFVFYQAGVDVLETDRLGKLALTKAGCFSRDELVFRSCKSADVPVQVSMGGGYSPHIRDIVDAHCRTFEAAIRCYD
ncbi:histone deacetylase family protein [Parapedobacter koreensis]|uniref:Acetoin utilization deacetylase AcuC n=1 Tax=Parapedobacter koreensis TaxID=332977 RepID=A0A1H7I0A4_9SPHI|nr:histone deacetylase [Parapedobacter koreensis]SEK55302.1 Acetoin utilization deacetylase AcuC [Parapedobacter koreensis]